VYLNDLNFNNVNYSTVKKISNMLKITRFAALAMSFLAILSSCHSDEDVVVEKKGNYVPTNQREEIALNVLDIMQNPEARNALIGKLSNSKTPVLLQTILEDGTISSANDDATAKLNAIVESSGQSMRSEVVEVPELWMYNPGMSKDENNVLVSFVPEGDENSWQEIVAYSMDGAKVVLDPKQKPEVPVIVVEDHGYEALKVEAELINERLRAKGLQSSDIGQANLRAEAKDLETTKLNKITLSDDHEPWILGDAEIYVITSGLRVGDVKDKKYEPEIRVIPLYYLKEENIAYYPNQVLLLWDEYDFQAANIQIFEKDGNYSWEKLAEAIVDGVFALVDFFTGIPWVSVLGDLASAILKALPDDWYINQDDYVDSFYTIEKGKTYKDYYGAAVNAKVDMAPYIIKAND